MKLYFNLLNNIDLSAIDVNKNKERNWDAWKLLKIRRGIRWFIVD